MEMTEINVTDEMKKYIENHICDPSRRWAFENLDPEYAWSQYLEKMERKYEIVEINGLVEEEADCQENVLHWISVYVYVTGQYNPKFDGNGKTIKKTRRYIVENVIIEDRGDYLRFEPTGNIISGPIGSAKEAWKKAEAMNRESCPQAITAAANRTGEKTIGQKFYNYAIGKNI